LSIGIELENPPILGLVNDIFMLADNKAGGSGSSGSGSSGSGSVKLKTHPWPSNCVFPDAVTSICLPKRSSGFIIQ